jgi:23S rRNA G2069 N7-methylase RlmK/C1962 C5-methylase RlmI
MANWRQSREGQWSKVENGTLLVVTHTALGDYRAEYRSPLGGLLQIGYYKDQKSARTECENMALGKPVTVGRRKP